MNGYPEKGLRYKIDLTKPDCCEVTPDENGYLRWRDSLVGAVRELVAKEEEEAAWDQLRRQLLRGGADWFQRTPVLVGHSYGTKKKCPTGARDHLT